MNPLCRRLLPTLLALLSLAVPTLAAADAEAARADHADVGTTTVKAAAERAAAAKAAAAKGKAEVCAAARAEHRRPVGGIRLGIVVRLQQRQSTVSSAI